MQFAIQAENLGKCYLIRHQQRERYATLRDTLAQGVHRFWQKIRHPEMHSGASPTEKFWALRNATFEIRPGERVGIIGRNGAGKSTLLKILSRITEPTTGRFITRGRVAALLEVGTGFHSELTGRENIYLNGAILGMQRSDVKRQFDAIVDFAGVEKFLDTPVKRYSSGMYVRLAFAVAAHLEPDILIVDEVLAVGDAEFQKKCLGKMEEVGKDGRTVVFVSHNMGAVRRLCDRGILVEHGILTRDAELQSVLSASCSMDSSLSYKRIPEKPVRPGIIQNAEIIPHRNPHQIQDASIYPTTSLMIRVQVTPFTWKHNTGAGVYIYDQFGDKIAGSTTFLNADTQSCAGNTVSTIAFEIPRILLPPGSYSLDIVIANKGEGRLDTVNQSLQFRVSELDENHIADVGKTFLSGTWNIE